MAIFFDNENEVVNCGSAAILDDNPVGTYIAWVYPDSMAGDLPVFCKSGAAGTGWNAFIDAAGDFGVWHERNGAGQQLQAKSNTGPIGADTWSFLASRWNINGVNGDQELFWGDLGTIASEVGGYVTQQVGAGAQVDAAFAQCVGNYENTPVGWFDFDHHIAIVGIWDTYLTLAQIRQQQYRPHPTAGNVFFLHLGYNEVGTQRDLSGNGNDGTVTNATQSRHSPLGPFFGWDSAILPLGICTVTVTATATATLTVTAQQ